jgi:hypothetical protein
MPSPPPHGDDRTVILHGPTAPTLAAGTTLINGNYVIEGFLARGGMGEVYRARHVHEGDSHAIKVILPEIARDEKVIQLFRREARELKRVNNDAIVRYRDFLSDEQGACPRQTSNRLQELRDALQGIDCAALHIEEAAAPRLSAPANPPAPLAAVGAAPAAAPDQVVIAGTVPNEATRARVIQLASRLLPNARSELRVAILRPPLCRSWLALEALRATALASGGLKVLVNGGAQVLHEGDPINIEIWGGGYPVHLRIDYFSLDGRVLHMLPATGVAPASR